MGSTDNGFAEAAATLAQLGSIDVFDPKTHRDIVRKCQSVVTALQDPGDVVFETLAGIAKHPSLVALSNRGVFEKLSKGPMTADQLAEECSTDKWLMVRLMRVATAHGIVRETGLESYAATGASNIFATPPFAAGLRESHLGAIVLDSFPKYLKETSYRNPSSYTNGLYQYHFKTELGSFEHRAQDAEIMRDFNLFMTIQRTRGAQWTENFNITSRIFEEGVSIDESAPLVVDVGGGFGQDLRLVKKELHAHGYEVKKGQLVLEDRGSVIEKIPAERQDGDVEYVPHDFFTPQPVRGARVYTFKGVIHDWPEDRAVEILRQVAGGLTRGYSKVWILDGIVPSTGADKVMVGLDIGMMAFYGALERTREQWAFLLDKVGLKIVDVQTMEDGFGLIEAMLA